MSVEPYGVVLAVGLSSGSSCSESVSKRASGLVLLVSVALLGLIVYVDAEQTADDQMEERMDQNPLRWILSHPRGMSRGYEMVQLLRFRVSPFLKLAFEETQVRFPYRLA